MIANRKYQAAAAIAILSVVLSCVAAVANTTSYWKQAGSDMFFKGKFNGTALTEDGRVSLGYKMEKLVTSTEPYFWSMTYDNKGVLWAGSGNKAILYRIDKKGNSDEYAVLPGVGISALAVNKNNNLFAAVFPGGKIFSIDKKGKKEIYATLPAMYVWDMEFDSDGNLFCVTGAGAGVYKIDKEKKVIALYTSSEKHFLSMFLDGKGGLYTGSSPSGMILKINIAEAEKQQPKMSIPDFPGDMGKIEDLETSENEIEKSDIATSENTGKTDEEDSVPQDPRVKVILDMEEEEAYRLLPLPDGNFLVAANQNQMPSVAQGQPPRQAVKRQPMSFPASPAMPGDNKQPVRPARLYLVTPEGRPRLLLEVPDPYILDMHLASEKEVVIGTGDEGRIYIFDTETEESLLQSIPAKYVLSITGSGEKLKIATGNPGAIFEVSPARLPKGVFISSVNDAETTATYGNLDAIAYVPMKAALEFRTRTGNTPDPTDGTWNTWSEPQGRWPFKVDSAPGRYIQYQAVIMPSPEGKTPLLSEVRIYYLTDNRAPYITKITALPQPAGRPVPQQKNNNLPAALKAAAAKNKANSGPPENNLIVGSVSVSNQITFHWTANDPDKDDLKFSLDFRRLPDSAWVELEDELYGSDYKWDTDSLPDGTYEVRLRVTDENSNPKARALTDEKISEPFIIDHTRPEIRMLSKTPVKKWKKPL